MPKELIDKAIKFLSGTQTVQSSEMLTRILNARLAYDECCFQGKVWFFGFKEDFNRQLDDLWSKLPKPIQTLLKGTDFETKELGRLWWNMHMTMEAFEDLLDKSFTKGGSGTGPAKGFNKHTEISKGVDFPSHEEAVKAVDAGTHAWVGRFGTWILLPLDFSHTPATTPKEALQLLTDDKYKMLAANDHVFLAPTTENSHYDYRAYKKATAHLNKIPGIKEPEEIEQMEIAQLQTELKAIKAFVNRGEEEGLKL